MSESEEITMGAQAAEEGTARRTIAVIDGN